MAATGETSFRRTAKRRNDAMGTGRLPACLLIAGLCIGGCVPQDHVVETTIKPDGSVERWVYQPALPEEPTARLGWVLIEDVPRVDTDQWFGRVAEIMPSPEAKENRFVRAFGRFQNVSAIPPHYRVAWLPGERRDGLQRSFISGDFVLCREFVYEESVAELTTQRDAEQAAAELVALVSGVFIETCREVLGDEWKLDALARWAENDVRRMFIECVRSYYALQREVGSRRELSRQERQRLRERRWRRLQEQLKKRFGLDAVEGDVQRYLQTRIRDLIRDRQGNRLDANTAEALSRILSPREQQPPRIAKALEKVLRRRFDGREEFDRQLQSALRRVTGVYGLQGDGTRFRFTVTMPGRLLVTDGTRLDDHTVQWSFYGADVFPDGYRMYCRSALPDRSRLAVFGTSALATVEQIEAYLRLCRRHPEVLPLVAQCVESGTPAPLRQKLAELPRDAREELVRLLGL
ncbi:MAG: hypothetical protein D6725_15085 [Planctomycetota bacterium]|nr:MAG: hypothetical protein D6725_15085 [Planctomycetota bacterium]